jgi:hypothetical protein
MNGIFANYLWTMFWGSVFWIFWIMWFFPRKHKYRCIRVYVWSKDDKHVIWMWIWLFRRQDKKKTERGRNWHDSKQLYWLITKISACRARIWSVVASERSERVTSFIFCRAGWYFSVSIIFTFRWHVSEIYVVYKLWFCTCYNMYKIIVHVITWTMQKYKL